MFKMSLKTNKEMKKILILGASGMAGHIIYTYLKELNKYAVFGTTHSNDFGSVVLKMNAFKVDEVENIIHTIKPDIIINCIGMLINGAKSEPEKTIYTNAYFPYLLKKIANENNAKVIHISTDCVFSGKDGGYCESSFKDATDLYGLSKNLGEIVDDKNLTIRTSIIGPELKYKGEGLFHWFMTQPSKSSVNGYISNLWSGVTTLELAKFIDWIIENPQTGLLHLTNGEAISKFNLLKLFNSVFQKNIQILNERDYVCDKSLKPTQKLISYRVPSYLIMLENQLEFMQKHKAFYAQYFS